jgi:hypothetical protein
MIHIVASVCLLFRVLYALMLMHGTGLTEEAACAWCGAGKYQTGVGLMAEANCTWCVAGKYQSGSGLNAAFWLSLLTKTPATDGNRYQRRLWLRSTSCSSVAISGHRIETHNQRNIHRDGHGEHMESKITGRGR